MVSERSSPTSALTAQVASLTYNWYFAYDNADNPQGFKDTSTEASDFSFSFNIAVALQDSSGTTDLTWKSNFLSSGQQDTGFTDAASNTETKNYNDPNNPYSPTHLTDRNGHVWTAVYADPFGNPQTLILHSSEQGCRGTSSWQRNGVLTLTEKPTLSNGKVLTTLR